MALYCQSEFNEYLLSCPGNSLAVFDHAVPEKNFLE